MTIKSITLFPQIIYKFLKTNWNHFNHADIEHVSFQREPSTGTSAEKDNYTVLIKNHDLLIFINFWFLLNKI